MTHQQAMTYSINIETSQRDETRDCASAHRAISQASLEDSLLNPKLRMWQVTSATLTPLWKLTRLLWYMTPKASQHRVEKQWVLSCLQFALMVLHISFGETVTLIYLSGPGSWEDIEIPADGCHVQEW